MFLSFSVCYNAVKERCRSSYPHGCAVSPFSSGNMRAMERVTAFYEERMSVIKKDLKKDE